MDVRLVPIYRKKAFWSLMIPLLIILGLVVVWFVYFRPAPLHVTLKDGLILATPSVLKGIQGPIGFLVENQGTEPHQFLLVSMNKPPGEIPVKDGVAQFFSEPTDMNDFTTWTLVIYDGFQNGGFSMPGPQENPPLGPPMQPGEEKVVTFGKPTMKPGPLTVTILCNLPGHYERGEYATVMINK